MPVTTLRLFLACMLIALSAMLANAWLGCVLGRPGKVLAGRLA